MSGSMIEAQTAALLGTALLTRVEEELLPVHVRSTFSKTNWWGKNVKQARLLGLKDLEVTIGPQHSPDSKGTNRLCPRFGGRRLLWCQNGWVSKAAECVQKIRGNLRCVSLRRPVNNEQPYESQYTL